MRKLPLYLCILLMSLGCRNNMPISDKEIYGNTFIKLGFEDFHAPIDWETHDLFYGAFKMQLPPYMKQTENKPLRDGYGCAIFMYRDSTEEYHYGRLSIDYNYHRSGGFNKANEYIKYSEQVAILEPIVRGALSSGKIANYTVPEGEIINGPFYDNHNVCGCYVYDAYYRRKGHTSGEGPVSCHIFLLMNKVESALITVSYHDKDSVLFDNLFNAVKTFRWSNISH